MRRVSERRNVNWRRLNKWTYACAVLLMALAPWPFAFADGSGPIDPFPTTGAYSAFHREDRDHISIIEIAGDYNRKLSNGAVNVEPRAVIAREFLRMHPDRYDFLVAFSTFEFNTGDALAFHWAVQNKVKGIGVPEFDISQLFGSRGKLQGFVDMAALTRYQTDPLDPQFETVLGTLSHEILHQWGSHVRFKQTDGSLSSALLGRDNSHWSYLLDSDGSVEYGADWRDNGDGTFTSVATRKFYSALDLYLMGFYKPQEVPPFSLIENAQVDKTQLPQENVTISGTKRAVTIEDVIAAEGPREPAAEQAQKEFRIGFILLVGPNGEVTDEQIAALNNVRNAFMTRFSIMTAGRAVASVYPEALPTVTEGAPTPVTGGDLRTTPTNLEEGLAWLRSRQSTQGFWSDKDTTAVRDTTVTLSTLASLDVAFTGASSALQWLNQNPSANSDSLARHARLLTELGGDASPIRSQLVALQNSDGGWGIAAGYQSNPLDTALALSALSGTNPTAVDKAATYLLSKQNIDGGWSNAPGSPSRATVTTTVLQALKAVGRHATVAPAALTWLKGKQNTDGGFGDSPSTVHDTANALQSFIALDAISQIRADDAAGYLLTRQTTAGSWEGSVYATASAVAALKRFSFPNWNVAALSAAPISPRDGDRVKLTINVKNDANVFAPVGVLRVYDGDPASGGVQIGSDLTIPTLAPGAAVTFNPLWDTFGKAGAHTLVAVVDPNNAQTEMSERDNRASVNVTVQPAPAGVDLSFAAPDIVVTPAQPNRLPTTLGISVSVRNLGLTDAQNVRVLLWAGAPGSGTLVGQTTLDVLNRSTVVVNFSYVLTKPGAVNFTAQLDPDNTVAEADETNNAASLDVSTTPSVDLVVTTADIGVDKNPAIFGDDVNFRITLHNQGTSDAPTTQVRYLITDGITTKELRTNTIELGAGQSTEQTLAWRVDLNGSLTFTAQLDPSGLVPELDKTNNVGTLALNAGNATGPNLVVSFQDFSFAPNPGREGYALVLSAVVRNTGTVVADNAEVVFYNGDPAAGGTPIGATQIVPSLAPGASTAVSVTWPAIPDSTDKLLFVVADPANKLTEFSENDNSAFNVLPVLSLPDLAISSGDIQLAPPFPKAGDSVALTARVANLGAQEAANVVVRAFDGDPAAGGVQIGTDQTIARINGFDSATATFNWSAATAATSRPIVVQVDPLNAILERNKANNTARRDVAVQDGNLYVTNKYFSPDGDGVKDSTQLFFRLQNAATVTVDVLNKRDKLVRRFSGASLTNVNGGDMVWDGLDDLGRVVQDGAYRLRVVDTNGATLGEIVVSVDTNRSSLLEAAGTKFENFSNLTCELPDLSRLQLTSDDASAFFYISSGTSPQAAYPKGIYRMEGDGTDIRTIVPESFFATTNEPRGPGYPATYSSYVSRMDAAANGSRVSFVRYDNFTSKDRYWLVDGDGKNLKRLDPKPDFGWGMTWTSPDGNTVYTYADVAPSGKALVAIPADGIGSVRTVFNGFIDIWTLKFSADGRKVAFVTNDEVWLLDVATGASTKLSDAYDGLFAWSPNSARLAVFESDNSRFAVFDQNGALVRTIDVPVFELPPETDFWDYQLSNVQWSSSSTEFGFTAYVNAYTNSEGRIAAIDPGGIYVADLVTGKVEKTAAFRPQSSGCGRECAESYHVSTWDGSKWAERGVLHYGMHYQEKTLDLSKYLPDASGQFRVRIRQQGMEAAHVESVALVGGANRYLPESALHLGTSKDVVAQVLYQDNEVLDLHEAEMEVRWSGVPSGSANLRLAFNAREEILSNRKALPFSYPSEPERVYEYRLVDNRPLVVDGNQTAQDGLTEPLFKAFSRPNTGHPSADVYGYVQSDAEYLYGALDFTVDNTMDGEKDWASMRVKTAGGWKEFRVTVSDRRYGSVGFIQTGMVHHTHKYYEFRIPLSEIGAGAGDTVGIGFQAYGTAAIIVDEEGGLDPNGSLYWVPGERSLLYEHYRNGREIVAILLDDGNRQQTILDDWAYNLSDLQFSPTGRQLLFWSSKQALDPTSTCYRQGYSDRWSFKSLLNLTADLRAIRSAKAGGVQLKGTASDLNFSSYTLEYTAVSAPNDWKPIAPSSGQPIVDDFFTTWVPPAPGTYFVRLSVEDLAGNVRRTVKRVSWADIPSITDLYRTPGIISPNGDGVLDTATIHYRVLEPVHLEFNFYSKTGERVRTIARDHSVVGAEVDLVWDGRDDRGLPVPDGEYRMAVQNYEFFIIVDSTPPALMIALQDAYQPLEIRQADGTRSIFVAVDPRLRWSVTEPHHQTAAVERGTGADPLVWDSFVFHDALETGNGVTKERFLRLDEFVNQRFRIGGSDTAGNRNSVATPLGKEELIVRHVGNFAFNPTQKKLLGKLYLDGPSNDNLPEAVTRMVFGNPINGSALFGQRNYFQDYFVPASGPLNVVPYVPMDSTDTGTGSKAVESGKLRIEVSETLRSPVSQFFIQFRKKGSTLPWTEAPATALLSYQVQDIHEPNGGPRIVAVDMPVLGTSISNHYATVLWNMAGLEPETDYDVRLHAIDSGNASHLSNVFAIRIAGFVFLGFPPDPGTAEYGQYFLPAMKRNPPQLGEYVLWGREWIGEPLAEVRLFVQSEDDPRYVQEREVGGVFTYPDGAFTFNTAELTSCKTYFGRAEGRTEGVLDPQTGKTIVRTYTHSPVSFRMPCLDMKTKVVPVAGDICDGPSKQQVLIKFAPSSLDRSGLKLLTLSRPLPNNGGDDVLFNVNKPESVPIPPSGEQRYPYEYMVDVSQLPEGPYTLTAKLVDVNDQQVNRDVIVTVDLTPPTAAINYPVEDQRVCGVPVTWPNGSIHNIVPIEGVIDDVGGQHYQLYVGTERNTGELFHDSRSLDSNKNALGQPSTRSEPLPDYHLHRVAGQFGALFDVNGRYRIELKTYDIGGFLVCRARNFEVDGIVEVTPARIDRALFSPNADGVLDEATVSYGVDEAVTIDADVYPAARNADGTLAITGPSVRKLLNAYSVLPGSSAFAWDGRNDANAVAPDGLYVIELKYKDACGNLAKHVLATEVDNTPPDVAVAYPRTSDQLPMIVEIQGSVNDPHLQGYGVDYGVGSFPDAWVRLANKTSNTRGVEVLAPWNTYGQEGAYATRVVAVDSVGNQRVVQVPLNLAVRTNLISYLEATPTPFSPNGDGKRESTSVRFGLEDNVLVTLTVLDKIGTVKHTLVANQPMSKGAVALNWDGKDDAGNRLPDEVYTVGLLAALASNPLLKQEEKISVILDQTAPTIDIARPAGGFVPATGGIVGTIQDDHIAEFSVAITDTPTSPTWEVLVSGTNNRPNATFGSLQGRAEGEYALKVDATDLGEIASSKIIPFIIDNTPPKANLTAPEKGSFVGKKKSPANVTGTLEEKYLKNYKLNVGNGDAPLAWTELASGSVLPLPAVIKAWDVSALVDGVYTLQFYAEDKAGLTGESRVTLTVDNTPPTVAITLPTDASYVTKPMDILGSANDANFAEYKLEVAPGAKGSSSRWSEIGSGVQAVTDGVLLSWQALPPDGVQTLRLTAQDKADNVSETLVQVTVDTKPPLAPLNLKGTIENRVNARLIWTPNTEPDLAGYAVYRDGVRITPALLPDPTYLDANLLEGRYTYTVTAFDKAGWESTKSNEATLIIDVTPPTTQISLPGNGTTVSGLLDVKGTAYSVDDFKEYRLYVGAGAAPSDFQLLRRSPVPVLADLLTQWNTVILAEGAQFTLKLESEDINGNVGTDRVTVTIDNLPPAAPTGLVATPNGSNVQLNWNANTEPDLYGYLVFRNERLANLKGVLVGSLKPYAVVTTSYPDLSLPDGPYTYYIVAIDKAGNTSDPSNLASVTLDTRPPHATVVQPVTGTMFDKPLYVLATSPDTDIAKVQFQYRAVGAPTWLDLGTADTALPYEATFDPAALGLVFGNYQMQAIATDVGNKADPAPTPITVTYIDVTAPAITLGLTNRVNGGDVALTWTANTDADLAGYHIERRNTLGSKVRLTSTPVTGTSYVDSNVADGTYYYTVIAVDTTANAANPSAQTEAVVYTPALKQPYTPTRDLTTSLAGTGRGPATLSGEIVNSAGSTPVLPVEANAQGAFTLANLGLVSGTNVITLRMTDSVGNVSKSASVTVVSGTAPAKPTGLTAVATGYNVALAWNANPETNVIGYRVFRNGQALLPDAPMTDLTATASTEWSAASDAVDFNINSYWSPITFDGQPAAGQWLALSWPEPRIVSQVTLAWNYVEARAVDFDLEAWTGSAWVTVAQVRDNASAQNTLNLAQAYRTTQLRLVLGKINNPDYFYQAVQLSEIGVFSQPLVATNNFADLASDGNHQYTVSAVNDLAFESAPSDPAALPVGDVIAPEPVTLSASVSGADVTLTWTASAAADVARYTIYRDGILIATHTDILNLSYVDAARPNGTYVYVVKAMDNANNESAPSNAAPATVFIAPPPAPVSLAVTAVTGGGALDLAWAPGSGLSPSSYRILRSTTAGGPYQPVSNSVTTQARDAGLVNGTTYFYVIAALDVFGNASVFSNEASGTPLDQTAPVVDLHYPTRPGRLYTTGEAFTTVVAQTEAGAAVTLRRNGATVGQTQALATRQVNTIALETDDNRVQLSPDGRYALYQSIDRQLRLYDFTNGANVVIVTLPNFDTARPMWSADGRQVLYIERDSNTGSRFVRAYRVADQSVRNLTDPSNSYVQAAALSPDGQSLAVIGEYSGDQGLWRMDLATGTWTMLGLNVFDIYVNSLSWSPDSTRLAYTRWSGNTMLEIFHLPSASTQLVDDQAGADAPRWSPDGSAIVFASVRDGSSQLWRYKLTDGTSAALTQGPDEYFTPQWSPDGRALAYDVYLAARDTDVLQIRDIASGLITTEIAPQDYLDASALRWQPSGYLVIWMDGQWQRIALAGRTEFKGVVLAPGDNVFSATATDAVGNVSGPSDAIVVNYRTADLADLAVADSDLRILPAAPLLGEAARVTLTVRNLGAASSAAANLSLLAVDPQGTATTLLDGKFLNPIAAGGAQTLAADWTVTGGAGDYSLVAIVDPLNELAEVSEANNLALRSLRLFADAGQHLAVTTDKPAYVPGETVLGAVTLGNNGETFTGRLEVAVEDQSGYLVQNLLSKAVSGLAYSATQLENVSWPTANTYAGAYQLHARLIDDTNRVVAEATAPFSLGAASQFGAHVTTDRAVYVANNNVRASGDYTYTDGNAPVSGVEALLRIVDSSGAVLAESRQALGDMLPGASGTLVHDWNSGTQAAGQYRAVLGLTKAGATLASAETLFRIEAGAAQLAGSLVLSEQAPAPGTPQTVTFTVRNQGNAALTQLPIIVSLLDPDSANAIQSQRSTQDVAVGGEATGTVTFSTATLSLKTYTVVLQAEVSNSSATTTATLATAGFSVVDRAPPAVDVRDPGQNGFIRGDAKATVFALDALSSVKQVEINVDGLAWVVVPVHNAAESLYGDLLRSLPEGTHTIAARATDVWNNTGSTVVLPFIVDNTPPQITVNGVAEGRLYNVDVTPLVTFTDAYLDKTYLTLNGTTFTSGNAITADGDYLLVARASDKAGNTAQANMRFSLDKTPPQIVVSGVQDGEFYNVDVTPVVQISDLHLASQSLILNGQVFVSGTKVTADGRYELRATATDVPGNQTVVMLSFTIDKTAPGLSITGPADGSVLSSLVTDVYGSTEPYANVFLTVGTYQAAALADADGRFDFIQVPLIEGDNVISAYARDRANNIGPTASARVRATTRPPAELEGKFDHGSARVLVWLPGMGCEDHDSSEQDHEDCESDDHSQTLADPYAALAALVEATLRRENAGYLIVRNEGDFIKALRTRRYTTLLLTELHHGGSDDDDDDDDESAFVLHVSDSTAREIQATVASGVGFVWIKTHPDENEHWNEIFGAKILGALPKLSQVVLENSAASTAGTWETSGSGLRMKATTGTPVGQLLPGKGYPAMIIHRYSNGSTALMGFDPARFSDAQGAVDVLAAVIRFATPASDIVLPGAVAGVRWTASKLVPPIDLRFLQSLPEGMRMVLARDGSITGDSEAVWERSATAERTEFEALVRLPMLKGNYSIAGQLYEKQAGSTTLLIESALPFALVQDRDDLGVQLMNALNTLSVPNNRRSQLQLAIALVQDAIIRPQLTRDDAAYSIGKLLEAMEALRKIEGLRSDIIEMLGALVGAYQTLWASYP